MPGKRPFLHYRINRQTVIWRFWLFTGSSGVICRWSVAEYGWETGVSVVRSDLVRRQNVYFSLEWEKPWNATRRSKEHKGSICTNMSTDMISDVQENSSQVCKIRMHTLRKSFREWKKKLKTSSKDRQLCKFDTKFYGIVGGYLVIVQVIPFLGLSYINEYVWCTSHCSGIKHNQ